VVEDGKVVLPVGGPSALVVFVVGSRCENGRDALDVGEAPPPIFNLIADHVKRPAGRSGRLLQTRWGFRIFRPAACSGIRIRERV